MKKLHRLFYLLPFLGPAAYAQEKPVNIEVEAQAIGTTNDVVPFWMRSNQYGSVPSAGASGSLIGRINKDYDRENPKKFDWGFGFEGRGNAGKDSRFILIEGYAKAKAGIFQLKAGRTKDVMGLNGDTTLSSGNFAVSGNALGIPKIEISIPEYWRVPIFDGLFSIKGNFSHGWLGRVRITDSLTNKDGRAQYIPSTTHPNTFFHQKSLYVRVAKQNWRISLIGGFNHNVFWGAENELYGSKYDLSEIETFFYVATGKTYGSGGIPKSKLGNQLGSIDFAGEYKFDNVSVMLYRQFFYDTGALSKLANIEDGLTGLVLKNKIATENKSTFIWRSALLEFFYSKNQAGESSSPKTNSGDEDYYNNYLYKKGWSYFNTGLGNPLITPSTHGRHSLPHEPNQHFLNNRVIALHLGFSAYLLSDYLIESKFSYSRNYGTYLTSPEGRNAPNGEIYVPKYGLFGKKEQYSAMLSIGKNFKSNFRGNFIIGVDKGDVLYNSSGLAVTLSKKF